MTALSTEKTNFDQYSQWKGWGGTCLTPEQARGYVMEIERAGIRAPGPLLEIGFGNGEFLQWAEREGFTVTGVEILPELVEQAKENGKDVRLGNLCDSVPEGLREGPAFAALVALDVLEHLPVPAAKAFLRNSAFLATPETRFLLRFPNGGSPFSAVIQNGDYTHQQALTESKLRQLCVGTGWQVERYGNAARSLRPHGKGGLLRRLVYPLRNLLEIVLGNLYYGHRIPLDPVATAVLIRDHD